MKRLLKFVLTAFISISVVKPVQAYELLGKVITTIKTTPYGILAGENDSRVWNNPYNGIYINTDIGQTWNIAGLQNKGVTDIEYDPEFPRILATTYYINNSVGGLYASNETLTQWSQLGPNVSTTQVKTKDHVIYLGTYAHGLWVSSDDGLTWEQKIGDGFYGPKVNAILAEPGLAFVALDTRKTYQSTTNGNSWTQQTPLDGVNIKKFLYYKGTTYYLTKDTLELYRYASNVPTVTSPTKITDAIVFKNYLIGVKQYTPSNYVTVFSTDAGATWQEFGPSINSYNGANLTLTAIQADKDYVLVNVPYANPIQVEFLGLPFAQNKFMELPWQTNNKEDLITKISSFFDHQYPLLGYINKQESLENIYGTTNYQNKYAEEPFMYYSSHNGVDFALPLGTPIQSVGAGVARYSYCKDCGNTITVDHLNGYQSVYMHLQNTNLVTKDIKQVNVTAGQTLGLVGLTGKTTGPHLHFGVKTNNKFPDSLLDPFGWQSTEPDPWESFIWQDSLGLHAGTQSTFLWGYTPKQTTEYLYTVQQTKNLTLDNKTLTIYQNSLLNPHTIKILNASKPRNPDPNLKYLENTALEITATDSIGNVIHSFTHNFEIKINLDETTGLESLISDTLKIYWWNETQRFWEPMQTIVDLVANTVTATSDHLSYFAVFGEIKETEAPESLLQAEGPLKNNVFTDFPTITITSYDLPLETNQICGLDNVLYSLDNGDLWEQYKMPFTLYKTGVTNITFYSTDKCGNKETTKNQEMKIWPINKNQTTVKLKSGVIQT